MVNWENWMIMFVTLNNGNAYDIDCWNGHTTHSDIYPKINESQIPMGVA